MDIYLDVDGVLFSMHNGRFHLRDGVIDFLYFLTRNFANCYWLTNWNDEFNELLEKMYAGDIARKFKTCNWKVNKALAIDYSRKFLWIEDCLYDEEIEILIKHNCLDSYIYVEPKNELDILYKLKNQLKLKFNIE